MQNINLPAVCSSEFTRLNRISEKIDGISIMLAVVLTKSQEIVDTWPNEFIDLSDGINPGEPGYREVTHA